ncbi:MAG: LysR family transcriptional regulator, partial [Desulfobacula sp.]|nr:LysR family transcriptional regulator [Desulfobacula sp.]
SVQAAADELFVSQSAISHQLSNLEKFLNIPLFYRRNRRLILTDVGRDYMKQIGPAFESINNALAKAIQHTDRESLIISAPPTLISNWLLPRLNKFLESNKKLNLTILEKIELDPSEKEVDCAIEYRFQPSKDYKSIHLIPDEWVPLASPELCKKKTIRSLEDLKGVKLIETSRRLISWQTLLAGVPWLKNQSILSVSYSFHAFRAAELGLGVALGNLYNANTLIKQGRLVIPFKLDSIKLPPEPRYFFSVLPHKAQTPKVIAFSKWILAEVEKLKIN